MLGEQRKAPLVSQRQLLTHMELICLWTPSQVPSHKGDALTSKGLRSSKEAKFAAFSLVAGAASRS
jgi:hypothetical protein